MYGAVLVRRRCERLRLRGIVGVNGFDRFDGDRFRCSRFRGGGGLNKLVDCHEIVMRGVQAVGRQRRGVARLGGSGAHLGDEHAGFLLAPRGHARLLVFVVRIARRATRLLHLVLDHRNHRVIGDAALTRTVVVENVTEPKPALLH